MPASWKESLHQFVLTEGYMKNDQHVRGYRVGIDARFVRPHSVIIYILISCSCWIYKQNYHSSQTKNAQLASLHANLHKILNMTLLPVFVFDGPSRPKVKRKKVVPGNSHWLENDFKELLTAYGFPFWVVRYFHSDC